MSNSESGPDFTLRASVEAKLRVAGRLIETASQQLRDPSLSPSRRADLQRIVEDTRMDIRRFQKQKKELDGK